VAEAYPKDHCEFAKREPKPVRRLIYAFRCRSRASTWLFFSACSASFSQLSAIFRSTSLFLRSQVLSAISAHIAACSRYAAAGSVPVDWPLVVSRTEIEKVRLVCLQVSKEEKAAHHAGFAELSLAAVQHRAPLKDAVFHTRNDLGIARNRDGARIANQFMPSPKRGRFSASP